jgi:signal transduction histidine kinase
VLAERTRISRELHDTIAQGFSGVTLQLEAVATKLEADPAAARENLDRARLLARSSLAEARRSVRGLRPGLLQDADLAASLREVAAQLAEGTAVEARVRTEGAPHRLDPLVEANLLRVAQEAMANALRHADCRTLDVALAFRGREVEIAVADDGRGFETAAAAGDGVGVVGMRERMEQIGGRLRVESEPGRGTRIVAVAPASLGRRRARWRAETRA